LWNESPWPVNVPGAFWPIPLDPLDPVSLKEFIKAFEHEGYEVCGENSEFEDGYEKVAIFVDQDGIPTHAARMLPSGIWTSKMGKGEDIDHDTLNVVEGNEYGKAKAFLKKSNPLCRRPNLQKTFFSHLLEFLRTLSKRFSPIAKRNQTNN
jgi:hypothetical protein